MDIDLEKYILDISSPEDEILAELYRKTHTSVVNPNMISGHLQGRFLEMMIRMIKPLYVLEIGTYTGYSAICMAKALPAGGMLHTIEINDELKDISLEYAAKAGVHDRIVFHTGDAGEVMKEMDPVFDFIFIDGDKRQYTAYYEGALNILKSGGFILADNALWDGKVINTSQNDPMTGGIREFNSTVKDDDRTENIIIPAMDGMMLIRKL